MNLPTARKTVLLLSGFRLHPGSTGGHIRSLGVARALVRLGYRVQIYSIAGRAENYPPKGKWFSAPLIDVIEPDLVEETHLGLGVGLLQAVARRLDYPRVWQYRVLASGRVPRRLKQALTAADIILADTPYCPPVPGPWANKPWYLLSHNLEFKLLAVGSARQRSYAGWMEQIEAAAPATYTDIIACAEEDQAYFRAHDASGQRHIPLVRCGVDPQAYRRDPVQRQQVRASLGLEPADRLLAFAGSRFGPNLEALEMLRKFCSEQADYLRQRCVFILVLGSILAAPERQGNLIGTGRVPEVVPYFAAADAGLNPIVSGSGANVKLFEYLAARLPIISTRFGVRGTELQSGEDYIEYTPPDLKSAIERFCDAGDGNWWAQRAEAVWARHASTVDIDLMVRDAVAQLPGFAR